MKKVIKVLFKCLLGFLLLLVIAGVCLKLAFNEDIPQGTPGAPADALAEKMLEAINHEEYLNAQKITWAFRDKNHYDWFPQENRVVVSWDDIEVNLLTQQNQNSSATKNGVFLAGDDLEDAIEYALKNFNNDSFWMVAPHKIMDPGTEREIIKEDAQEKLLVRYSSGGSTPGDVYVWKLDSNYRPQNYKMWVSIIPLDGIEAKWEDWEMTEAGFPMAMKKTVFGVEIPITEVSVQ
ncbi:hypothetical protein SAMN05192588_1299 [Nonlabens sp. Hel1_33_55]|uniref:hypothetical protein n=1 Tax=Nonlabens sp. Hel1_33_55 TaxID=1336802 RepID=UPI000875AD92|nr:hypothetical protein [Nonlabens sp. Hel1_33_55]SCY13132.1 hypothetical protein SAMN05192588_1299 [Nonlabens sp. Hel1_33_55]